MTTPRAIILAAGRGERMRPLTDTTPKPLLPVHGKPLIVWHLEALSRAGVRDVVINTAWLEDRFEPEVGDGAAWGLKIHWSPEGRKWGGALETAGGIATALPWLAPTGVEPFWVVSGDIHAPGFAFDAAWHDAFARSDDDALLWLVPNPAFHPKGDFGLDAQGRVHAPAPHRPSLTYANIALVRPRLVAGISAGTRSPLGPALHKAAAAGRLAGQVWEGPWENVGTPEQWRALNPSPSVPP